jgi:uncharacterized repeat protein (TIGR03803 family)
MIKVVSEFIFGFDRSIRSRYRFLHWTLLCVTFLCVLCPHGAKAQMNPTTLVQLNGTNGSWWIGTHCLDFDNGLVLGPDGNFYGTTWAGGQGGYGTPTGGFGTFFRMTSDGTLNTLLLFDRFSFHPTGGLVMANDGNFYGVSEGGAYDQGTVYRVTPLGAFTSLFSFDGTNGCYPNGRLLQGGDGALYGTTENGGAFFTNSTLLGYGTVFRITTNGVFTSLASFNGTNGVSPMAGLIRGTDGNFYGTTLAGGTGFNGSMFSGVGTVFKADPMGALTTLAWFNGTNGSSPWATLVQGRDGALYGSTYGGGESGKGTLFRVTTGGDLTTLVSFYSTNGLAPQAAMIQGSDGNFYGTTPLGGQYNNGIVFRLTPDARLETLVTFTGVNSANPARIVQGPDGNLYGETAGYPSGRGGTIYRLAVPMAPVFQSVQQESDRIAFTLSTVAGQRYQIQYSADLTQTNWTDLGTAFTATNGVTTGFDSGRPDAARFYRAVLQQ